MGPDTCAPVFSAVPHDVGRRLIDQGVVECL